MLAWHKTLEYNIMHTNKLIIKKGSPNQLQVQ